MGKSDGWPHRGRGLGHCLSCHTRFIGPGDRCPKCVQLLRERKRRKPR